MRYILLPLFLYFAIDYAYAQGENSVWTFGHNNGLNFNTTPPSFFQRSNNSTEGCASIADAAGNLLFYSNGNTVWTAAGAVMPNGNGILGNGPAFGGLPASCAQGVVIVQSLSNSNQYYLFVLDAAENITPAYTGYLRYSIVDMSLNGGNGDVLAAQKNTVIDESMSEHMTITKGAGCYYWLIAHRHNSATYRAFKISATGIGAPVSSTGTWPGDIGGGQLKVSPDGTKIATNTTFVGAGIEVGSFDNATGMISNTFLLDAMPGIMRTGTCFSPDNSKLYISSAGNVAQFDLAGFPSTAAIQTTKVVIGNGLSFSHLRNGPDGKIYVAFYSNHSFLGVINEPNQNGMGCNPAWAAMPQPAWAAFAGPGGIHGHGLGNDVVPNVHPDTVINGTTDTLVCANDNIAAVSVAPGADEYLWNDGTTGQEKVLTGEGTYWVYSYFDCLVAIDTFKVRFVNVNVDLGADTAICNNDELVLDATFPGASYRWQDGSGNATYTVDHEGDYHVKVSKEGCIVRDTIHISSINAYVNIKEEDTKLCDDQELTLHAEANPESMYQWNTGSTGPETRTGKTGTYTVTASNACGTFKDSVDVIIEDCDCNSFVPNAFTPNGDQLNDEFKILPNCGTSNFVLSIYNRFGQRVFNSPDPDKGWNGMFGGKVSDAGTYFYYAQFHGPRGDMIKLKGDLQLIR